MRNESSESKMADEVEVFIIDEKIKQKLQKHSKDTDTIEIGLLFGSFHGNKCSIVSCCACQQLSSSLMDIIWEADFHDIYSIFPQGNDHCGFYISSNKQHDIESSKTKLLLKALVTKISSKINRSYFLWDNCQNNEDECGFIFNAESNSLSKCNIEFRNNSSIFSENMLSFRIQASFQVCIDCRNGKAQDEIIKEICYLCYSLQSATTAFYLKESNRIVHNSDPDIQDSNSIDTCQSLLAAMGITDDTAQFGSKKSSKGRKNIPPKTLDHGKDRSPKDVIDVKLLTKVSTSQAKSFVPVLQYKQDVSEIVTVQLPVDVVAMATKDTSLNNLPSLFISAISHQLKQLGHITQKHSKGNSLCSVRPYHFKPPGYEHLLNLVYPTTYHDGIPADDSFNESYRMELHKILLLPVNQPLLRNHNAYVFDKDRKPEVYLINPHCGITSSESPDRTLGLVDGKYSYHHYMQDNFNDNEWGCAYRSLQTICSWFRHQGYTDRPVPTHHEIQQALVDIGDKKENFVASRQWIGSFEVSMCLEHLLGITSKIMYVNSGADMAGKGRELLHHFNTQGTPIMIGGGVLAHTIIGVDYNEQTGDIRFLILDPHYTGSEDLKIILDKGWVGWKGQNFWNQQAHYNMCMPQRPDMI